MADPRMQLLKKGWYWEVQPAKFVLERYRANTRKLWCPSPKCIGRGSSSFNRDSNGTGGNRHAEFRCASCGTKFRIEAFFVDILNGDIRDLPESTNWESLLPEPVHSDPVSAPSPAPVPTSTPARITRTESKFPPRLRISVPPPTDDDSDFIPISRMKTIRPRHISGHPSLATAASASASSSSRKRSPVVSSAASSSSSKPSSKPSSCSHSHKRKRDEGNSVASPPLDQATFFRVLKKHKEEVEKVSKVALEKLEAENREVKHHLFLQSERYSRLEMRVNEIYSFLNRTANPEPVPIDAENTLVNYSGTSTATLPSNYFSDPPSPIISTQPRSLFGSVSFGMDLSVFGESTLVPGRIPGYYASPPDASSSASPSNNIAPSLSPVTDTAPVPASATAPATNSSLPPPHPSSSRPTIHQLAVSQNKSGSITEYTKISDALKILTGKKYPPGTLPSEIKHGVHRVFIQGLRKTSVSVARKYLGDLSFSNSKILNIRFIAQNTAELTVTGDYIETFLSRVSDLTVFTLLKKFNPSLPLDKNCPPATREKIRLAYISSLREAVEKAKSKVIVDYTYDLATDLDLDIGQNSLPSVSSSAPEPAPPAASTSQHPPSAAPPVKLYPGTQEEEAEINIQVSPAQPINEG
ncbi:hypothetical protein AYI68_g6595, partial [Smittium mucronatum]